MNLTYIRRFRMQLDLADIWLPPPSLPDSFSWVPWANSLVDRHAAVKYASFQSELDARVFPCLGDSIGCRNLMQEISLQKSFLPKTTWLISRHNEQTGLQLDCATIQGLRKRWRSGSIQNVGVAPAYRGLGLGRALVLKSLHGFREAKMRRVTLEVTAENETAVTLYKSVGFQILRTMYNAIEAPPLLTTAGVVNA